MDVSNTTFTQPPECYYSRDASPSLGTAKDYTMVPLHQTASPNKNMTAILDSCCLGHMWIYSNPKPCTAVCNSTSSEKAQQVQYCLNAQHVDYVGDLSGAGRERANGMTRVLLLCGLVLSGML